MEVRSGRKAQSGSWSPHLWRTGQGNHIWWWDTIGGCSFSRMNGGGGGVGGGSKTCGLKGRWLIRMQSLKCPAPCLGGVWLWRKEDHMEDGRLELGKGNYVFVNGWRGKGRKGSLERLKEQSSKKKPKESECFVLVQKRKSVSLSPSKRNKFLRLWRMCWDENERGEKRKPREPCSPEDMEAGPLRTQKVDEQETQTKNSFHCSKWHPPMRQAIRHKERHSLS